MILPGLEDASVASWAAQWYADRKNERLIKERIWSECIQAYECRFGESWADLEDYRSKRYLSLPWQAAETVSATIVSGSMPSDWFDIQGRTPDDDSKAQALEALLKYQHYRTKFRSKVKQLALAACITGNVPWCVDWREDLLDIPGEPRTQLRAYDGPDLHIGNIFDFVIDLTPSDSRFALRAMRTFRTKEYLQAMSQENGETGYRLYENIDQISNENIYRDSSDSLMLMREREIGLAKAPKDMVELIQFEGNFEIPNVGFLKNHILVVANRRTVIRFEPNPFLFGRPTWELFTLSPEPNEVYGRGILEPVLGINDGIQTRYNQVLEAGALTVNCGFKYKEDGVFDPEEFVSAPGMLVKCADPNNIAPLVIPDKSMLGFKEIDFAVAQFNLITGAQANFGGESATQVALEAGQSKQRTRELIDHFSENVLMEILNRQIALNQQLMDEATYVRVTMDETTGMVADPDTGIPLPSKDGSKVVQVAPEDIVGQFDVYPVGSAQVQQDRAKAQDVFQLTTAILQSPLASSIRGPEFVAEIYKLAGVNSAWKFVKSPQEVEYERQREENQQLALAASKGLGGPATGGENAGPGVPGATGPEPGPGGSASVSGVPEGPGDLPTGPSPDQLAANRLD